MKKERTTIEKLQQKIHTYEKRYKTNQKNYLLRQRNLREKLKRWKQNLKEEIEIRESLKRAALKIKEETTVDVKKPIWKTKTLMDSNTRNSFFKIALENGVNSRQLAEFTGVSRQNIIQSRKTITRNLPKKPNSKVQYNHIKSIIGEIVEKSEDI